MSRYLWLLALPLCWGINNSSGTYIVNGPIVQTTDVYIASTNQWAFCMDHSEQWAKDLAAALNEAHERRTNHIIGLIPAETPWKDSKKADLDTDDVQANPGKMITNKEACGEEDCGKEPK